MKQIGMDTLRKREPSHREVRQKFHQNPRPISIKICDEEANNIRMKVSNMETRNNMRCYGDQMIMKEGQIASASVKETIREIDA